MECCKWSYSFKFFQSLSLNLKTSHGVQMETSPPSDSKNLGIKRLSLLLTSKPDIRLAVCSLPNEFLHSHRLSSGLCFFLKEDACSHGSNSVLTPKPHVRVTDNPELPGLAILCFHQRLKEQLSSQSNTYFPFSSSCYQHMLIGVSGLTRCARHQLD